MLSCPSTNSWHSGQKKVVTSRLATRTRALRHDTLQSSIVRWRHTHGRPVGVAGDKLVAVGGPNSHREWAVAAEQLRLADLHKHEVSGHRIDLGVDDDNIAVVEIRLHAVARDYERK